MLISLNWLKDFVNIPSNQDPKILAEELTLKTAEVERVITEGEGLEGVLIGEIVSIKKHPNADKLNIAKVNVGKKEPLNIVFGQMAEMHIGDKVPVAVAPTTLPDGMKIEKRELRGEPSEGMLCLDQELGLKAEGVSIQFFPNVKPGTPLKQALNFDDTILEFENKALTNRPDLWGHYGIAREIAAIKNLKLKPLLPKIKIPTKGESPKIEIKDFELCPRFCGLIINNIKVEESPRWLKNRLKATGHGAHNNIVDVTNYVMSEIGQPMHAFDKNLIKGGLIIRRANNKEKLTSLDGKERILDKDAGVVGDHTRSVAIAGIIGGQNSEINPSTTSIILEAANWHPARLRRTSIKLGVRTDAVQRFEKSLDPNLTELAIKRAAELILKICPTAKIAGPITDVKDPHKKNLTSQYPTKILVDPIKTSSKIGAKISPSEIKKILEKLEFKVKLPKSKTSLLEISVPSFRATKDIKIEDDIIEEVVRIYGYENIPSTLAILPTKLPIENIERFKKHRARELFSFGLGFDEVYNYSFYGKREIENCMLPEKEHIKLLNYLSEDQTHLRVSLIPNIIKNLQLNTKNFEQTSVYEIGHTYKEIGEYFPLEEKKISGAVLKKEKFDDPFYEAKGAVETFFEKFNLKNISQAKGVKNTPFAHPSKALSYIDQNGQTLAEVFVLHPTVQKNYDLEKYSIAMFEINFTEALKLPQPVKTYEQLPKFPNINIDISVVIPKNTEIHTLKNSIMSADKLLIKEVSLFDIYEGEGIAPNQKAAAFTITLRADDRTLTDAEMSTVQSKIFKNLEGLGGKIRGR